MSGNFGTEIPLPMFGRTQECSTSNADNKHGSLSNQVPSQLPPPPPKGYNRLSSQRTALKAEAEKSSDHQLQVQSQSSTANLIGDRSSCSPESASSPLTSQMIHDDKTWTLFHNQDSHLSWTQFEEHHHLLGNEEDSSERLSSDDEYDVWTITDEQKEYYANQFKSMQPEVKSKISGSTAKEFFEKSKLPVHELSKIWQLSDVDKDGALTLDEFCTAMHLVVLRRNKIDLPEALPSSLLPRGPQKVVEENSFPSAPPQPYVPLQTQVSASPKQRTAEVLSPQNKESFSNVQWTKFNDSPTSCMSSPGMKPVNFDFSAASVEQDPRILHPVALRLSPDGQPVAYGNETENLIEMPEDVKPITITSQPQNIQRPIPRKPAVPGPEVISAPCQTSVDVVGHSGVSSFSGLTASSASQGSLSGIQIPKKEPPPPPPPRSNHNHARSSSLDLNQLGIPPAVPPRISPNSSSAKRSMENQIADEFIQNHSSQIDFADFANFIDSSQGVNLSQPQLKSGAFEIYKKPQSSPAASSPSIISSADVLHTQSLTSASDDSTAMLVQLGHSEEIYDRKRHVSAPLALFASSITSIPKDKRELQSAIRAHRERNMMLTLMNNELNQELSEVMEERIALEIQLEPLKPFS